ncbi:CatB-related O-acetyltransferase [Vibrio ostreae]|uniref:Antibiotic acetyltransferase n=1 Tax=Vibrio ostreae TaxID=2841925 RepID=A0A975U8X1_9VIBR|nr:CatB-related O-acetyltransferase [Vibrio ostreae]QXO17243.1 hypothetical protein KNV97_17850 [Vibrio ostreae]
MKEYELIDSELGLDLSIYQGARVKNSTLIGNNIVGNFSRVDYSILSQHVRIDRNNQIYHSQLGRYSYTGMNTVIMHASIGQFCSISWNVTIGGANHDYERMTQHSFLYNDYDNIRPKNYSVAYQRFEQPVDIGNDVWIAAGAVITRGVKIGHGAVVGSNAVVTKDVPAYAIVVGNPAKVLKYRFSQPVINKLLEIQWWDWSVKKITDKYATISDCPNIDTLLSLLEEKHD